MSKAGVIGLAGAAGGIVGALSLPTVVALGMDKKDIAGYGESEKLPIATFIIVGLLNIPALPISIVCAPVVAPAMAVWFPRKVVKGGCYDGDLSPESDDEIS